MEQLQILSATLIPAASTARVITFSIFTIVIMLLTIRWIAGRSNAHKNTLKQIKKQRNHYSKINKNKRQQQHKA